MTTDTSNGTSDGAAQGIKLMRWLVGINLGIVALQAVSAGFLMSGYARALTVHDIGAVALQGGALAQAVAAAVMWRRRRVPAWVAGASLGLFVSVFLQSGFGFRKYYWLHVPMGVAIFGALTRHVNRLDIAWRTTRARS